MTNVTATSGDTQVVLDGAVVSVSTQAGSGMVYVYSGSAALTRGDESMTVESGHVATFVAGGMEQAAFAANSLSEGQMAKLVACGMDDSFCLTKADLDTVRAQREAEKQKAQQELIAQQEAAKQEATKQESAVTGTTDSAQSNTEDTEDTEEYDTASYYCAIEIRCDTILDNMGNLTPGKESYVPASGTILGTTRVGFDEGETVFDVLKRVCDSAGIQIEYSWTPIYDSYYVEGINHLYEFDCGELSGWMYKVNGWFPNYGSSSYDLENGDTIVWCYTCEGLGADVGGSVF
ncbi:MAG: DUF4430 domain-containing protein [Oscillospiraceae bacterium]|nr:DUF4430 domain-containing protein [Oscillospiraceae bacterium]